MTPILRCQMHIALGVQGAKSAGKGSPSCKARSDEPQRSRGNR